MIGMTSEQINLLKSNMKNVVDFIEKDNYEESFRIIEFQFGLLRQLYELGDLQQSFGTDPTIKEDNLKADSPCVIVNSEPEVVEQVDSSDGRPMYQVTRRLRGASVEDIEGYIPESVLRDLDIEHGDYVYAKLIDSEQNRYLYELAEKVEGDNPTNRVEYAYCPVEVDGDMLVVNKSLIAGDRVRYDGSPYTVLINQGDVERYALSEGDLIDVAFYDNNPSSVRVVWKHPETSLINRTSSDRKKSSVKKNKSTISEEPFIEQVFAEHTICIVGDMPNESMYKQLIEERGGEHVHIEPKWNIKRIETLVRCSDVVVGLYDYSEHTGLEKVKEYCKLYNVPFEMISGRGKSKTIQTATDLISSELAK